MKQWGGKRNNSGRKPKADELSLFERMDKLDPDGKAWEILWNLVKSGDVAALKLWLGYRNGAPAQTVNQNTEGKLKVVYETDGSETSFAPPSPSTITNYS